MKDVVKVAIEAPVESVAMLFANPEHTERWMEDSEYQPLSGSPGMPGSKYRLVSRSGQLTFTATVVTRKLPGEVALMLEAPSLTVSIRATFVALPGGGTELSSEETFTFKRPLGGVFAFLARPGIHKAHRRQMESFKRFAEQSFPLA
jgi:hypothetical protein